MKKIKSTLFNILERAGTFFVRVGINRRTPGVLTVYKFFFNKFWPYTEIIEVQGSKIYINSKEESLSMKKTLEDYAKSLIHERATTDLFERVIKEGDVVVDLGANIGYFSLLAAKLVGSKGRVFSFEPEPKNFSYLKKNIEINNYNQVSAFQKAVSNKNGKTKLYICDYDTGHHTINQYEGVEAYSRGRETKKHFIDIETITLDDFFKGKEEKIDVIKIDVEGAEMLALLGMDRILKENKNIKMFVEFFPLLIEKMRSFPKEFLRKIFEDYGFSIYVIPDDYDSSIREIKKMNSIEEIMAFRQKEEDHVNLFMKRENV